MDQCVVKNEDHLSTGYGQEPESDMYHGGALFFNTDFRYIYVQNQVSLDSEQNLVTRRESGK